MALAIALWLAEVVLPPPPAAVATVPPLRIVSNQLLLPLLPLTMPLIEVNWSLTRLASLDSPPRTVLTTASPSPESAAIRTTMLTVATPA